MFPNRIRELRHARGWTLQRLADAVGTTKSQIDKLEKGFRRLTVDWMVRLAKPLKCDPRDLMIVGAVNGPETVKFADVRAAREGMVPLHTLQVSKSGEAALAPKPADYLPRPYFLLHMQDVYALQIADDAMEPMYRPRQVLFVNPYKTPVAGGGVVITDANGGIMVRELVRQKPDLVLREYKPKRRDITLAAEDVAAIHAVAGTVEP
jgi:transcriptional regulator with XRE-family HTH domain